MSCPHCDPLTAAGRLYRHPMLILDGHGRCVGYLALCGCEPRYLPAESVSRWEDREAWMDLESWRNWIGGSLGGYHLAPLTCRPHKSSGARRDRHGPGAGCPRLPGRLPHRARAIRRSESA
jgi:hypothetical protein